MPAETRVASQRSPLKTVRPTRRDGSAVKRASSARVQPERQNKRKTGNSVVPVGEWRDFISGNYSGRLQGNLRRSRRSNRLPRDSWRACEHKRFRSTSGPLRCQTRSVRKNERPPNDAVVNRREKTNFPASLPVSQLVLPFSVGTDCVSLSGVFDRTDRSRTVRPARSQFAWPNAS